jgi:hypothetical protein
MKCKHCLHETCKDSHCKGNHTLNGHTAQCIEPYLWCCVCDHVIVCGYSITRKPKARFIEITGIRGNHTTKLK